jgi:hypothetical protein
LVVLLWRKYAKKSIFKTTKTPTIACQGFASFIAIMRVLERQVHCQIKIVIDGFVA